ncbi:MAG: DUF2892 domain-containing protein [Alcanivoracaceae bacterium]|nr:DUF2892 domain-containing protein [Alcanivoracaceae bacterium]
METNVGTIDRTLRLVAGVAIIAAGAYYQSWWGLVGLVPLFTGTTRWCPAYLPFGISTCRTRD